MDELFESAVKARDEANESAVVVQSALRGHDKRTGFLATRRAAIATQAAVRRGAAEKQVQALREDQKLAEDAQQAKSKFIFASRAATPRFARNQLEEAALLTEGAKDELEKLRNQSWS